MYKYQKSQTFFFGIYIFIKRTREKGKIKEENKNEYFEEKKKEEGVCICFKCKRGR